MKLTNKQKTKIKALLLQAIKSYSRYDTNEFQEKFIIYLQNILQPESRSLPEQNLYWQQLEFIALNIPDMFVKIFDCESINKNFIHELLKAKFKVTSTSFTAMDQQAFNEYHRQAIEWLAMFFWKMTPERFNSWFMEVN